MRSEAPAWEGEMALRALEGAGAAAGSGVGKSCSRATARPTPIPLSRSQGAEGELDDVADLLHVTSGFVSRATGRTRNRSHGPSTT